MESTAVKRTAGLAILLASLCACPSTSSVQPKDASARVEAPDAAATAAKSEERVSDLVQLVRDADEAFQRGDFDKAVEHAEAAIALSPTHPLANNVLGRASLARHARTSDEQDLQRALVAFTRAAHANPDFWPAHQNLGELHEKTGRPLEAAAAYQKVLAAEPNHPEKARYLKVIADAQSTHGKAPSKKSPLKKP
jgi:tetratricopeptide (TPR) repeat protein